MRSTEEIKISSNMKWKTIGTKECLHFTFSERLTEKDAIDFIADWKDAFAKKPNQKVSLIWDCAVMKEYEPMARSKWQNAIKEMKSQIDSIWIITTNPLIAAGGKIMSLMTSYDMKVVKSEDKIVLN